MFSFLSRLRLPIAGVSSQEDDDDASSVGRSLSLPWPVTESSVKRTTPSTTRHEWTGNHAGNLHYTNNPINISHPIPRTPNSLTGFDSEFPAPPSGSSYGETVHIYGQGRRTRPTPPFSALGQGAWYEQEGTELGTQPPYSPPEVVRLDSNPVSETLRQEETSEIDTPPPKYAYRYTTHPSASSYALPYPTSEDNDVNGPKKQDQPSKKEPTEYETDSEHEFYTSPFEPDPSDAVRPATPTKGIAFMTKSRWNLKIQLHSSGAQSSPSLPSGTGTGKALPPQTRILPRSASQNPIQGQNNYPMSSKNGSVQTMNQHSMPVNVDTDVYNNAYNYPLAKQLSPIAEQDYISPGAETDSRSVSLKFERGRDGSFSKASPGAESTFSSVLGRGVNRKEDSADMEKESTRTKTGSIGSVGNENLSRAGSASATVAAPTTPSGSVEFTRPSPIYSSPFITRHLNRTVSQTSSKSDSQPQVSSQAHTPTASQSQTLAGQSPAHKTQLSTSSVPRSSATGTVNTNANSVGKESTHTPTSPGTTSTTPTGTMYTPTSAITHTPNALTPTSPIIPSGSLVQPPPAAVTVHDARLNDGLYHPKPRFPKIPSLPSIPPLDLRFSVLGSLTPRLSKELRLERLSKTGSTALRSLGEVERMPIIDGSVEGVYEEEEEMDEDYEEAVNDDEGAEEEEESEEYDRESLHADSFVTAGTNEDGDVNMEDLAHDGSEIEFAEVGKSSLSVSASKSNSLKSLRPTASDQPGGEAIVTTPRSINSESFIHRRWERDAALGFGGMSSSPTTFRAKGHDARWPAGIFAKLFSSSSSSTFTPAFWAFWLGFICPVLWFVGGWHFTNAGELPPKYTIWEWYFWNSRWSAGGFRAMLERILFGCCSRRRSTEGSTTAGSKRGTLEDANGGVPEPTQRRKGKRRSTSAQSKARAGKIFPALPQWVAEKQSTDDGRMRLNDPKRSLRGISFGYPFISRPPGSQDSGGFVNQPDGCMMNIVTKPNRMLDLLYGVQLKEVRGRPESGRRMFDPWIQRCRYAFCYAMVLLAIGLCIASAYLITVDTKKLT